MRHAALLIALPLLLGADAAADWVVLGSAEGIELHEREVPGEVMPAFRAIGVVEEDIHDVLAVVYDVEKHPEWVHDCREARMLELKSDVESYIYHRIKVSWPLGDRDATMHVRIQELEPGAHIRLSFEGAPHENGPPLPGVTRMTGIHGHYDLKRIGEGRTRVEYEVTSDPRVFVPRALVLPVAREMPFRTLLNLRSQIQRTRGQYAQFIERWKARSEKS